MKKTFVLFCFYLSLTLSSFAQDRIYEWKQAQFMHEDSVKAISFRKMKLSSLPQDLSRFKQLTYLDLGNNKLKELPLFLSEFQKLEVLDVSRNKLDSFPDVILLLPQLKKLILNRNNINRLPESLVHLQQLTYLDLWDNPLPDFPEALSKLPNLKEFHVEGIQYGPKFQEKWKNALPGVRLFFDPPCDCKD